MKSKIRKLEADLKRSEKDRQRENARHADELKSNNEDNAAKVAELDRHFGELKPKHEQALVAEKLQGVEEGKKLTRDERDAEVKSSETTIENLKREDEARMSRVKKIGNQVDRVQTKLNKAAEENQEQTGKVAKLDRRYTRLLRNLCRTRREGGQSTVRSRLFDSENRELEETVLKLTKYNEGKAKTIESRAKQMATEMADHRVKAAHDSVVKEGQRLSTEWQTVVQRMHTVWKAWAEGTEANVMRRIEELEV